MMTISTSWDNFWERTCFPQNTGLVQNTRISPPLARNPSWINEGRKQATETIMCFRCTQCSSSSSAVSRSLLFPSSGTSPTSSSSLSPLRSCGSSFGQLWGSVGFMSWARVPSHRWIPTRLVSKTVSVLSSVHYLHRCFSAPFARHTVFFLSFFICLFVCIFRYLWDSVSWSCHPFSLSASLSAILSFFVFLLGCFILPSVVSFCLLQVRFSSVVLLSSRATLTTHSSHKKHSSLMVHERVAGRAGRKDINGCNSGRMKACQG